MHASIDISSLAFISVVLPEGFLISLLKSRRSDLLQKKKKIKENNTQPFDYCRKVCFRFVKKLFLENLMTGCLN